MLALPVIGVFVGLTAGALGVETVLLVGTLPSLTGEPVPVFPRVVPVVGRVAVVPAFAVLVDVVSGAAVPVVVSGVVLSVVAVSKLDKAEVAIGITAVVTLTRIMNGLVMYRYGIRLGCFPFSSEPKFEKLRLICMSVKRGMRRPSLRVLASPLFSKHNGRRFAPHSAYGDVSALV